MPTDPHVGEPTRRNATERFSVGHAHEPDAVRTKAVAAAGFGLLGLILVGLMVLYVGLRTLSTGRKITPSVTAWEKVRVGAGVNPHQRADRIKIERAEQEWLEGYGWQDEGRTVARIPIERAMQLLAQRGLRVQFRSQNEQHTEGTDDGS